MLENQTLWDTATRCHELLAAADIPHALLGGVAVCLHGYQRNTVDVDLLVRKEDAAAIKTIFERERFRWQAKDAEFRSPAGVAVQILNTGDRAGPGSEVALPDPAEDRCVTEIEGLPVLTLARLIETKLACGIANLRRTHKDFADVVELIHERRLGGAFARFLHKSLRPTFRQLVRNARGKP